MGKRLIIIGATGTFTPEQHMALVSFVCGLGLQVQHASSRYDGDGRTHIAVGTAEDLQKDLAALDVIRPIDVRQLALNPMTGQWDALHATPAGAPPPMDGVDVVPTIGDVWQQLTQANAKLDRMLVFLPDEPPELRTPKPRAPRAPKKEKGAAGSTGGGDEDDQSGGQEQQQEKAADSPLDPASKKEGGADGAEEKADTSTTEKTEGEGA